jgi:uncharacterized protein YfkK (UPF0435 family)
VYVLKQQIDTEIYSEKTIATYETKYRDNPLSKPQDIVLTITSAHLYGKAFVCEQIATMEEDIFYSKFSASIADISNISINTYIREYPIYISFDKPNKDNKNARDRKRIILPSFEYPENIVAQITEAREKLKIKNGKKGKNKQVIDDDETYHENFGERFGDSVPVRDSEINEIIDVWDEEPAKQAQIEINETLEISKDEIKSEVGTESLNFTEIEADSGFDSELDTDDDFLDEVLGEVLSEEFENEADTLSEPEIAKPPVAPAPPTAATESARTETKKATKAKKEEPEAIEPIEEDLEATKAPEVVEAPEQIKTTEPVNVKDPVKEPESVPETKKTPEPVKAAVSQPQAVMTPAIEKTNESVSKVSSLESFEESMKKLKIMLDNGVITPEEFAEEKRNILKTLY